jgi:large subunit ribosomal protein L9
MIEVILLERIERLGPMGQVVKVRPGYARNFLLPQKKALRATKENLALFEKQRAELEAKNAALRAEAQKHAEKMDGLKFVIIRQASEMGMLYGSVTARDVAEAAKEAGHAIDRTMVQIDTPIKTLGLFPVKVKLHPEVTIKITVNVARSAEEAVIQAEKGVALIKAAAAAAEAEAEKAAIEAIGAEQAKVETEAKAEEPEAEPAEEAPKKAKKPRAKKAAKTEEEAE